MKKYSSDKDINLLVASLCKSGWTYLKRKKHGLIQAPNGRRLAVPTSPSDWRSSRNFSKALNALVNGGGPHG